MPTLSVVIPAYNEESSICEVIAHVLSIRAALTEAGFDDLELIVVDDGSRDRTAELVAATPGVRLIRHASNSGYGAALKTGFAAVRGEWIGFLDADGTYPPEHFPILGRAALAEHADIVIGSRMAGSRSEMPLVRRIGNLIFANLVSLVSAQRISDSASGMRVFRKSVLERIYPLPDGLNLTPVMSTRALHERLKMIEVPIPYSERRGRSKLSVVRDGIRFTQSIVWTALNYNPVQPLGLIGLICLILAAVAAAALVVVRLLGVTSLGYLGAGAVFADLVLAVTGVSILALGVSFNYFVALFHHQPVRQGLFGRSIFPGLEQHFGWMGTIALGSGILVAVASLVLGSLGRPVVSLWLYYLGSASLVLVGIQLIVAWVQIQVLDALRVRARLVADDMRGKPALGVSPTEPMAQSSAPGGALSLSGTQLAEGK